MTRTPNESERDFLSRWSQRKQDARREPEETPEPTVRTPPPEATDKTEAEVLEELGLPDPDSLGPGSDFKAFMAEAVPDWLRRRALRRLWVSNPTLANLDMLVDYGEDYTDKATVVANLQSAYKAGRGYFDRAAVQDAPAEADEPADASVTERDTAEPSDPAAEAQETEEETGEADAAAPAAEPESEPAEDVGQTTEAAPVPPRRRRMQFDFDES